MDETTCKGFPETDEYFTNQCKESQSQWREKEKESKGSDNRGRFEETVCEDGTKKDIPPIYDKPYSYDTRQQNKKIHVKVINNNEEVRKNDVISRGKSCSNSARIEHMQAPMGKLCRMCAVGSDERTKWTSCQFVQPCYRIGKDVSHRPLHNVSESSSILIEPQGLSIVIMIMKLKILALTLLYSLGSVNMG
ncbi:hypothetical protein C1646_818370 [Rhizophagus diaphanus]|nr:hypothetical protein C1646_818370 [Rhizophagus diaphanus] [Rhizophagus sp. MUCL 43196]